MIWLWRSIGSKLTFLLSVLNNSLSLDLEMVARFATLFSSELFSACINSFYICFFNFCCVSPVKKSVAFCSTTTDFVAYWDSCGSSRFVKATFIVFQLTTILLHQPDGGSMSSISSCTLSNSLTLIECFFSTSMRFDLPNYIALFTPIESLLVTSLRSELNNYFEVMALISSALSTMFWLFLTASLTCRVGDFLTGESVGLGDFFLPNCTWNFWYGKQECSLSWLSLLTGEIISLFLSKLNLPLVYFDRMIGSGRPLNRRDRPKANAYSCYFALFFSLLNSYTVFYQKPLAPSLPFSAIKEDMNFHL